MLPNLFIIGGIKCASTSLHEYLSLHPQIAMSDPKELHFFTQTDWQDDLARYEAHFDPVAPVRGESTTHYSWYPHKPGVPARIHSVAPDARFIYLVRDPVDRIVAHFIWCYTNGNRRSWDDWMRTCDHPDNALVCASRYAMQLRQYLDHFPRDSVLVLDQAELRTHRRDTLRKVFRFLEVDETFETAAWDLEHNRQRERTLTPLGWRIWRRFEPDFERMWPFVGRSTFGVLERLMATDVVTPDVAQETRANLEELLRRDADDLRRLTGLELASWSV